MAEQLGSAHSCVFVEQTVGIPVQVCGADFRGDLHGFRPESGSSASAAEHQFLQGFLPEHGSSAFSAAEHSDLLGSLPGLSSTAFRGEEHQGFLPGHSSTALRGAVSSTARGGAGDEVHRRRMQVLNNRVGSPTTCMSLNEAEWAARRRWMGVASSSSLKRGRRRNSLEVACGSACLRRGYWFLLLVIVVLVRRLRQASSPGFRGSSGGDSPLRACVFRQLE